MTNVTNDQLNAYIGYNQSMSIYASVIIMAGFILWAVYVTRSIFREIENNQN